MNGKGVWSGLNCPGEQYGKGPSISRQMKKWKERQDYLGVEIVMYLCRSRYYYVIVFPRISH